MNLYHTCGNKVIDMTCPVHGEIEFYEVIQVASDRVFVLTEEQAESIYVELKDSWIRRDNPLAMETIGKIRDWLCEPEAK